MIPLRHCKRCSSLSPPAAPTRCLLGFTWNFNLVVSRPIATVCILYVIYMYTSYIIFIQLYIPRLALYIYIYFFSGPRKELMQEPFQKGNVGIGGLVFNSLTHLRVVTSNGSRPVGGDVWRRRPGANNWRVAFVTPSLGKQRNGLQWFCSNPVKF